ncbi:MAG: hypothetical protein ACREOZ_01120, partial [Gloeomargaritales cyanobacterium]
GTASNVLSLAASSTLPSLLKKCLDMSIATDKSSGERLRDPVGTPTPINLPFDLYPKYAHLRRKLYVPSRASGPCM